MEAIQGFFKRWLDNIPEDNHDEYLSKLPKYKKLIDRTPNKFLAFHLNNSLKQQHYELAEYIKRIALNRGFNLPVSNLLK